MSQFWGSRVERMLCDAQDLHLALSSLCSAIDLGQAPGIICSASDHWAWNCHWQGKHRICNKITCVQMSHFLLLDSLSLKQKCLKYMNNCQPWPHILESTEKQIPLFYHRLSKTHKHNTKQIFYIYINENQATLHQATVLDLVKGKGNFLSLPFIQSTINTLSSWVIEAFTQD